MRIFKKLMVDGMSCQHCKHTIESTLKGLDGVKDAIAYYSEGYVNIDFDDSQIQLEHIVQEIEDLSYDVIENRPKPAASEN